MLLSRIEQRTNNPCGKTPEQRALVLSHLEEVEPLPRRSCTVEIDAAQPLAAIVQELAAPGDDATVPVMAFRVLSPVELEWITRPHEDGEPPRHVAELSERAGFAQVRANLWRYEPGARGRRHRHPSQEETFVVLAGTLTMYLGEPPERVEAPCGGLICVDAATALQVSNEGTEDLLLYVHGYPPEHEHAELLESAL